MRRRVVVCVVLMLSLGTLPLGAVSNPIIAGAVSGFEVCAQATCGAAVFVANFTGFINGQPASGLTAAAINHDPLPQNAGETAAITGGSWLLRTHARTVSGIVAGGTLQNNGNNTFTVTLTLVLTHGGFGTVNAVVLLNHNTFPPMVVGTLSQ